MGNDNSTAVTVTGKVKYMLEQENVRLRFNEVLGNKSAQFMASIVNGVSANKQLSMCTPNSILGAAFVAASYDLPIDSNLGYSALVPYSRKYYQDGAWHTEKNAQFQIMYKGFIQLAMRSGYYKKMNSAEVYEDELVSYNPILGEVEFVTDYNNCSQRKNKEQDKIIGYYAYFELLSGYKKELYMTKDQVLEHAVAYSKAYANDIEKAKTNKKYKPSSKWSTDFEIMGKKTVIKLLLSKWGILSTEMQRAIQDDQKVFTDEENGDYEDNKPDKEEAYDAFSNNDVEETSKPEIDSSDQEEV